MPLVIRANQDDLSYADIASVVDIDSEDSDVDSVLIQTRAPWRSWNGTLGMKHVR